MSHALLPRPFFRAMLLRAQPIWLLLVAIYFNSTSIATSGECDTNTLSNRIVKAQVHKQISRRLEPVAEHAGQLNKDEIREALRAAEYLESARERLVFQDALLKRWGELAPDEAFAYVSQLPEALPKVEAVRNIAITTHAPIRRPRQRMP